MRIQETVGSSEDDGLVMEQTKDVPKTQGKERIREKRMDFLRAKA